MGIFLPKNDKCYCGDEYIISSKGCRTCGRNRYLFIFYLKKPVRLLATLLLLVLVLCFVATIFLLLAPPS